MKNYKKILLGLVVLFAPVVLWLGVAISTPGQASAFTTQADADQCRDSLVFIDIAHIVCDTSQGKVTFTDSTPTDSDNSYGAAECQVGPPVADGCQHKLHYAPSGVFCDPGIIPAPRIASKYLYYSFGITLNDGSNPPSVSQAGSSRSVTMNVGIQPDGSSGCGRYGGGDGENATFKNTSGMHFIVKFNGNSITSLDGVSDGSLATANFSLVPNFNGTAAGLSASTLVFAENLAGCSDYLIVANTTTSASTSTGKVYWLVKDNNGVSQASRPLIYALFQQQNVVGCNVIESIAGFEPFDTAADAGETFWIQGLAPALPVTPNQGCTAAQDGQKNGSLSCTCTYSGAPPQQVCTWQGTVTPPGGGGGNTQSGDCYGLGTIGLEWFFCAVLEGIDSAVTSFYDAVQNQLCIQVDNNAQNSVSAGSKGCGEKANLFTPQVHSAWSSMRIIATSILVILMLVAVVGQAFGGGRGS